MSKDVINVHGEDIVVREDAAKAFRGVNWALLSITAFIAITGLLFIVLFWNAARSGPIESPSTIQSPK